MLIVIAMIGLGTDIFYPHIALKIFSLIFIILYLFTEKFAISSDLIFAWLSIIFVGLGFWHPEYFFDSAFFSLGLHVLCNGLD